MSTPTPHTLPLSKAQTILDRAYAYLVSDSILLFREEVTEDSPNGTFLTLDHQGYPLHFTVQDNGDTVKTDDMGRLILVQHSEGEVSVLPLMAHFVLPWYYRWLRALGMPLLRWLGRGAAQS